MSRYLLEHDSGHIIFESEEDCCNYIAIRKLNKFKINKIIDFTDDESIKFDEMIKEKKFNYKNECKERISKEIQELDFKLNKIGTELLYTNPDNVITTALLRCEMEKLNLVYHSKQKELEKYV